MSLPFLYPTSSLYSDGSIYTIKNAMGTFRFTWYVPSMMVCIKYMGMFTVATYCTYSSSIMQDIITGFIAIIEGLVYIFLMYTHCFWTSGYPCPLMAPYIFSFKTLGSQVHHVYHFFSITHNLSGPLPHTCESCWVL